MINKIDETIIAQLHDYLEDIQYGLIWQNIMSANDVKAYECIADYELMKRLLSFVTDNKMRVIYKLFLLGYKVPRKLLQNILSETLLDQLIDIGFLIRDNEYFFTDNYMILYIKGYYLVVDIPFFFPSCEKKNTDTYLGWDSFLLLDNHTTKRAEKVLDLCSGSGIQSIVASEHSKKTIAIEINPRAVWVSKFNVVLNSLTDLIECRNGDLYDSIAENETFDVIYANPPFLPVEESLPFSIIGHGGANGLKITKKILEGLDKHLKDDGEAILIGECLGTNTQAEIEEIMNWNCLEKMGTQIFLLSRIPIQNAIENLAGMISNVGNYDYTLVSEKLYDAYMQKDSEFYYTYIIKCSKKYYNKVHHLYNKWSLKDIPKVLNVYSCNDEINVCFDTYQNKTVKVNKDIADYIKYFDGQTSLEEIILKRYHFMNPKYIKELIEFCALLEANQILTKSL